MHVIICNREVPVELKSGRAMKDCYGKFNANTETISLLKTMDMEMRRRTVAHECFHAFLHFTGYNEMLEDISPSAEEALVRAFDAGMGDWMFFPAEIESWIAGEKE